MKVLESCHDGANTEREGKVFPSLSCYGYRFLFYDDCSGYSGRFFVEKLISTGGIKCI